MQLITITFLIICLLVIAQTFIVKFMFSFLIYYV